MKFIILIGLFCLAFLFTNAQSHQSSEAQFIENLSNNSLVYIDASKFSENTIQYSIYNPLSDIKNFSDEIVKNYCRKYKLDYLGYVKPSLYIKEHYSLINQLNNNLKKNLAIFNNENLSTLFMAKVSNY
jgi:hypothetical protein